MKLRTEILNFSGLEKDTYIITAQKNEYESSKQRIKLGQDEVKTGIQIKLKKKE